MTDEENKYIVGNVVFNPDRTIDQNKLPNLGHGFIPFSNGLPIPVNQGWQCPACKFVYAPSVQGCMKCNKPDYRGVAG